MPTNDSWIWQGRQFHMWFGHGTKPQSRPDVGRGDVPVSLDERIRQLGLTALAGLPASKRNHPSARFDVTRQAQLHTAMRHWVQGRRLSRQEFAARMFDAAADGRGVRDFHDSALSLGEATQRAHLRDAVDEFAAGMMNIGLDYFPRFLADAAKRANRTNRGSLVQIDYHRSKLANPTAAYTSRWQEQGAAETVQVAVEPVLAQGGVQIPNVSHGAQFRVQEAALRCEGAASGGCADGGSYGSSGMYDVEGKALCIDCATKDLKLGGVPAKIRLEILRRLLR